MHLMPADRGVGVVKTVEDALELVERGVRRLFESGCEEPACHLVVQSKGAAPATYTIVSVLAQASLEWPWNLLKAARGAAAAMDPIVAIWVMPGWKRDEGVSIYVERPDMTEEFRHAQPETRPEYALSPFGANGAGPTEECSYVCLPSNVVEFARRFGTTQTCDGFAPDEVELQLAEQALQRRAS